MFSFIKDHWIAYLIGALIALALGFGASTAIGIVGSTPEKKTVEIQGSMSGDINTASSEEESSNDGAQQDAGVEGTVAEDAAE